MYHITERLRKDDYVRPAQTFTDKLSKEDIKAKLEDYELVDDISKIPVGTHLRYFSIKNGERVFRLGGILLRADGFPDYIVLSNGGKSWSVQVKDSIFFRKKTTKEVKKDISEIIYDKDAEISKLKQIIENKNKQIKQLSTKVSQTIPDHNNNSKFIKKDGNRIIPKK